MKKPRTKAGLTQNLITIGVADMMDRHAVQLSEHVTSIQLMATILQPDGTTTRIHGGRGDLCARMKCAELWLDMAEEAMRS